jgi:hypothetical protein
MTRRLPCALAAAAALAIVPAAQAAAGLSGPSSIHVLQKVGYRASGLQPEGRYSLRIRRTVIHAGRKYRCAAFLAAARTASGTETFEGSLPDGLQCVPASGTGAMWQPRTTAGNYQVVACVAAARNLCDPGFAVATETVRVR